MPLIKNIVVSLLIDLNPTPDKFDDQRIFIRFLVKTVPNLV